MNKFVRQQNSLFCFFPRISSSVNSYSPNGAFICQSLRSQVSGNPVESWRSEHTTSSMLLSSARIKIAVPLCGRNATDGRYLPQCAAEAHYPHQRPFKLLTGGAVTAGIGRWHVSHGFKSQPLTNAGQLQLKTMQGGSLYNL